MALAMMIRLQGSLVNNAGIPFQKIEMSTLKCFSKMSLFKNFKSQ